MFASFQGGLRADQEDVAVQEAEKEDVVKQANQNWRDGSRYLRLCAALFQQMLKLSHLSPTCNHTTQPARREIRNNPLKNRDWALSSCSRNSIIDHDTNLNVGKENI